MDSATINVTRSGLPEKPRSISKNHGRRASHKKSAKRLIDRIHLCLNAYLEGISQYPIDKIVASIVQEIRGFKETQL